MNGSVKCWSYNCSGIPTGQLLTFLERVKKSELKWMYSHDIDDCSFGVETDRYTWCKRVIDGDVTVNQMLEYFEKYYPNDEKDFIEKIKELMGGE